MEGAIAWAVVGAIALAQAATAAIARAEAMAGGMAIK
jgi:hypothetical protein